MGVFTDRKINRGAKFETMEHTSKEGKREAEEKLLKPESIEPYTGELPKHSNDLEARTALIVFKDKAQMDLIGSLFNIRESCSGKSYITNIELLESIAKEVKEGSLYVSDGLLYVSDKFQAYKDDTAKQPVAEEHEEVVTLVDDSQGCLVEDKVTVPVTPLFNSLSRRKALGGA